MNTHADKSQADQGKAVAGHLSTGRRSNPTFQIVDNRPEIHDQRHLQNIVSTSPQVRLSQIYQELVNNDPNKGKVAQLQPMDISESDDDAMDISESDEDIPEFTNEGDEALERVTAITGEDPEFDPYDGFTFGEWHPNGARIGFNDTIRYHIIDNAPHDEAPEGEAGWITCSYCGWEYPGDRIQVDHVTNWADYSMEMTTADSIEEALAWQVYIGCNDPDNLVASCDSCNASKGDQDATPEWIQGRIDLANELGGF